MTTGDPTVDRPTMSLPVVCAASLSRVPGSAILLSGSGYGPIGRYSIYAALPRVRFEVMEGKWSLQGEWPFERPHESASPFDALRMLIQQTGRPDDESGTIFQGGWIGYFGYDLAPLLEQLPRRSNRIGIMPDLSLAYYDTFALHDSAANRITWHSVDRFGDSPARQASRIHELKSMMDAGTMLDDSSALIQGELQSEFTEDEFRQAVARVIEYLRAGDIFQANVSQEFHGKLVEPVERLFARTMTRCPVPFGAYLRGDRWSVISASPERFLLLTPDGRVETRPIKGTRPRGRDPIHDLLLREELAHSEKDAAELTMIVDLERNDLGRVCDFHTVRVTSHRGIESFSSVHHAVSVVEGKLRPQMDAIDLLMGTFPGGSITGAPKIRAMQIIDEIERGRRGVYTGAIGYISDHGRMDLNIAIRTMIVDESRVSYRVGGGIVVDSDPLAEYRETLAKGRQMRSILLGEDS